MWTTLTLMVVANNSNTWYNGFSYSSTTNTRLFHNGGTFFNTTKPTHPPIHKPYY